MPDAWTPEPSHHALARELGVDAGREAQHFRDWATANGKTFVRWDAAFSNWLRNATRYGGGKRPNGAAPHDRARDLWERAAEMDAAAERAGKEES